MCVVLAGARCVPGCWRGMHRIASCLAWGYLACCLHGARTLEVLSPPQHSSLPAPGAGPGRQGRGVALPARRVQPRPVERSQGWCARTHHSRVPRLAGGLPGGCDCAHAHPPPPSRLLLLLLLTPSL